MSAAPVEVTVDLGATTAAFGVVWCRVDEGISRPTHVELELSSTEDLDVEGLVGGPVRLEIRRDGETSRAWTLVLGKSGFAGIAGGTLRFLVELHAPFWMLGFTRNTRKFRNETVEQIVTTVLGECGVTPVWRTTRPTRLREYCVQYRESNRAFVERLLEFEGIYATESASGELVLADRSSASPRVPGAASFALIEAEGALSRDEVGVHVFAAGARVASGAVTVNDFNWKTPAVDLTSAAAAAHDAELEVYDWPSGFRTPAEGELQARLRLEALRARSRYVEGRGDVEAFAPAHAFRFETTPCEGEYLLVDVEHLYRSRAYPEAVGAPPALVEPRYENAFFAIPLAVPYRPARATPRPTVAGCHTAMVRGPDGEEIHTDTHGRFKAQFHWDREATGTDADSRWIRMLQETGSSMGLARIGWEVGVAYVDGDPDRPVGIGRQINGAMTPTYGQPAQRTVMTLQTPTSPATGGFNEIKLDDTAGAMNFYVRAERDYVGVVKHDRSETIGNDETRTIETASSQSVERDQVIAIGANLVAEIQTDDTLQVKGSRTETVGGNETVSAGSGVAISADDESETVGSVRLTICGSIKPPDVVAQAKGMLPSKPALPSAPSLDGGAPSLSAMMPPPPTIPKAPSMPTLEDLCQGQIMRSAEAMITRTVGGALVQIAKGNISTMAQYAHVETVGGVRLIVSQDNVTTTVTGPSALTVGGVVMRKSTGTMGYGSKNASVTVGGLAKVTSKTKLQVRSAKIVVEALTQLEMKTPDLRILLEPGSTTLEGRVKLETQGDVTVTGRDDNITT